MKEEEKNIGYIRMERDDCAALLRRLIHATRPGRTIEDLHQSRLRERAQDYLKRQGLQGNIIRTMGEFEDAAGSVSVGGMAADLGMVSEQRG